MASTFPGAIDSFTDPLSGSALNSPSHSAQHADLNDAVEKVETYMGLVKVIPTGATNGTVGATGTVTIGSAVASVAVAGCFSSLYDNYKIVVSGGVGSAATADLALQLGSATTNYAYQLVFGAYANVAQAAGATGAASFVIAGGSSTSVASVDCDLLSPFDSTRFTLMMGIMNSGNGAGVFSGQHRTAASFTGFTITPSSGTLTGGTIRVYGYRN